MLHKLLKPILLILLFTFAATATIWSQNLQQQSRDQNNNSDDYYDRVRIDRYLDVEIWSDHTDGEYYEGDRVTLFYRVNRDAFVVIYSIDTRGRVNILFPSNPSQDNFVAGGETHRLPGGNDDYDLEVSGPEGVENIQVIASREKFTIPDWYPNSGLIAETDDIHDYMDWLNMRYFVKYEGQRFAFDRTALYINEWEDYYFRPVYRPYYPSWTVSGNIYFDYWYGSSIYIDGIYWGISPLYIPRLYVGWHTFTVYNRHGHAWEFDHHISRHHTVVFDHTVIHTSAHVRSKYKKVRTAGYRAPTSAGYPNYEKKVKAIKSSGAWKTKSYTQSGSQTTISKKSQFVYTGKKKFVKGSSSDVFSGKSKADKRTYNSYRKDSRDSKSTADKRGSSYRGYDKKSSSSRTSGYKKRSSSYKGSSSYKKRGSKSGSRKGSLKSGKSSGKYHSSGRGSGKKGSYSSGRVKSSPRKSSGSKAASRQGSVQKRSSGSRKSGGTSKGYSGSGARSSGSGSGHSGHKGSSSGGKTKRGGKR